MDVSPGRRQLDRSTSQSDDGNLHGRGHPACRTEEQESGKGYTAMVPWRATRGDHRLPFESSHLLYPLRIASPPVSRLLLVSRKSNRRRRIEHDNGATDEIGRAHV